MMPINIFTKINYSIDNRLDRWIRDSCLKVTYSEVVLNRMKSLNLSRYNKGFLKRIKKIGVCGVATGIFFNK